MSTLVRIQPAAAELAWQDLALCAETDPEAFFVAKGESTAPAKAICRKCEVQAECLEYALANGVEHGVWGGTSEMERRAMRRQRRAVP